MNHTHYFTLAASLACFVVPRSSRAQTDTAAPHRPSEAPLSPAANPRQAEGIAHHAEGMMLLGLTPANYAAALVEFERAYELLEGHPERYIEQYNISLCHQGLQRYELAVEALDRYLREGGDRITNRAEVDDTRTAMIDRLGFVRVVANVPDIELWIDRAYRTRPRNGQVALAGGQHVLEASAPGFVPDRRAVTVDAHQTTEVTFRLVRVLGGVPRWVFWTTVGSAVAAACVGAGFGIAAQVAHDEAASALGSPDERVRITINEGHLQRIRNYSIVSTVTLGLAGALAVTAGVLAFNLPRSEDAPSTPRLSFTIVPHFTDDGMRLQLGGAF